MSFFREKSIIFLHGTVYLKTNLATLLPAVIFKYRPAVYYWSRPSCGLHVRTSSVLLVPSAALPVAAAVTSPVYLLTVCVYDPQRPPGRL